MIALTKWKPMPIEYTDKMPERLRIAPPSRTKPRVPTFLRNLKLRICIHENVLVKKTAYKPQIKPRTIESPISYTDTDVLAIAPKKGSLPSTVIDSRYAGTEATTASMKVSLSKSFL